MGTKRFFLAFAALQFFTLFLSSAQIISHKEFTIDVISSNNEVKTLTAGYDRNASDGIDTSFGEKTLPPYVQGQFDARFRLPDSTITTYKDFRFGCTWAARATHTLEWVNTQSVTISSFYLPAYLWYLKFIDDSTGAELASFLSGESVSFQPSNLSKKIKIFVVYTTPLEPPHHKFYFPQSGEVLQAGSVIDIRFKVTLSYADAKKDLFFSSNSGSVWEYIGTTPSLSDTSYSWTVPSINSDKCKIRVGDYPCAYTENLGTFTISTTVPVEMDLTVEKSFNLLQNYPNPFNPITTINYSVPELGLVNITVYDVLGREVKTLVNSAQNAGDYSVSFDASKLSGGIYYYQLSTNGNTITRKMILLK